MISIFKFFAGLLSVTYLGQAEPQVAQDYNPLEVSSSVVIFDGRTRQNTLYLSNPSNHEQVYEILDKGSDSLVISFSERSIKLAPGEATSIDITIHNMDSLEEREYMSEMVLRSSSHETKIPIVARKGYLPASAAIEKLFFKRKADQYLLSVQVKREGRRSFNGELAAYVDGNPIGVGRDLAFFIDQDIQKFELPISKRPRKGDLLTLEYREIQNDQPTGLILARKSILVR